MPSPSNIYAEKAYSEHPIAMWALDDQLDYVSYLNESSRNISSWTVASDTNAYDPAVLSTSSINLGQPLSNELYKIVSTKPELSDLNGKTQMLSPVVASLENMDADLNTFSIGAYFYADTEYVNSINIGYRYIEEITNNLVIVKKTFPTTINKNWIYLAETFDIPNYSSDIELIVELEYYDSQDPETEYIFYVNGLTLGQWSEEFQSESLGLSYLEDQSGNIVDFPLTVSVDDAEKAVIARSYGLQDTYGYYLASQYKIFAKNAGMPMVYGSNNATLLINNNGLPSLVVPANGFLNNNGRNNTYTLEAWINIDSISIEEHRVLGPVGSFDGIYVDAERIYLRVSDNVVSHTITEWGRPMLLHLVYTPTKVSLMLNSEQVISMPIDSNTLYLPEKYALSGKDQDWIGFFASDDVSVLLDCVGIYPYEINKIIAKRRWVYGQNVEYPENLTTAFDGKTVAIDYLNSNYPSNFVFPKNSAWSDGVSENLSFANNSINSPNHPLPEIVLQSGNLNDWLTDQADLPNEPEKYFRIKPNSRWESTPGYLYLSNTTFLQNPIKTIYGVFKNIESPAQKQILFVLRDKTNNNNIEVSTIGNNIVYTFNYYGTTTVLDTTSAAFIGELFVAGFDVRKIASFYGQNVISFLSNQNSLELFIAGNPNFTNNFEGNIYGFALSTERNSNKIGYMFGDNGIALDANSYQDYAYDAGYSYFGNDPAYWDYILDGGDYSGLYQYISNIMFSHTATYQLYAKTFFDRFMLDIKTSSNWEDMIPLSHFAKYVVDSDGSKSYDLDFIQFNMAYPAPGKFVQQESKSGEWTYGELQAAYQSPIQYSYAELDNELFSGFSSYGNLKNKTQTQYVYDTTNYSIKTYITFQALEGGANTPIESYTNTENVSTNNLVKAGDEWVNTKYEVVDGAIIYPPKSADFADLAIVVHLEIITDGIKTKPVRVPTIELASQALNVKSPTSIGTKFGIDMYPYTKSGIYFNYKDVNPFKIYKKSSPYLFLTRNSGIELVGDYKPLINRGISIPLNKQLSSNFSISAMQILVKYTKDFFPYSSTPIFEIQSKDSYIKFYLVATQSDGKRAKIYAINSKTGLEENGIAFYINGKLVKSPTLSIKEWTMIGIYFAGKLNLDKVSGAFRLTGPIMMNHMSYYQSTGLQEKILTAFRVWDRVKETILASALEWSFWKGSLLQSETYTWNNVLVIGKSSFLGINLSDIYKAYVGTNKTIFDDNRGIRLSGYKFRTYTKTSDVSFIRKPS